MVMACASKPENRTLKNKNMQKTFRTNVRVQILRKTSPIKYGFLIVNGKYLILRLKKAFQS